MDSKRKKILLWAAVAVALFSLLTGWYFTLRKGVYAGGDFYYKVDGATYRHNAFNYITFTSDHAFRIVTDGGELTGEMQTDQDEVEFSFSDGTHVSGQWNGMFFDSGSVSDFIRIEVGQTDNGPAKPTGRAFTDALYRIYSGQLETISQAGVSFFGLLIYILGIVNILYPEEIHFLFNRWRYRSPELSDEGILVESIGGAVICVMGVIMMSGAIFLFVK